MRFVAFVTLAFFGSVCCGGTGKVVEVRGAKVELYRYEGDAEISAEMVEPHKLKIEVNPKGERQPLPLRITLWVRGRERWSLPDVVVTDNRGESLPVKRSGIEWRHLFVTVPAKRSVYYVIEQRGQKRVGMDGSYRSGDRVASDTVTGLEARICDWYDGRKEALSIRFDDSHPTHLTKAIPTLREFGFKGTFMINPGNPGFLEHKAEWEAVARRGDMEFANHTMHHCGAASDEEAEREIGDAAKYIRSVMPHMTLIALNLGGGTEWITTRSMRYYLKKYRLFDASSGSLGMDDVYGNRVEALRRQLERHIERGGWCRIHFHSIGVKGTGSSEENFRAAMELIKSYESRLWIAGMADIYKYQTERNASRLSLKGEGRSRAVLRVECLTDARLYNQPLTVELKLPQGWSPDNTTVSDNKSGRLPLRADADGAVLRFDIPPVTASYLIAREQNR